MWTSDGMCQRVSGRPRSVHHYGMYCSTAQPTSSLAKHPWARSQQPSNRPIRTRPQWCRIQASPQYYFQLSWLVRGVSDVNKEPRAASQCMLPCLWRNALITQRMCNRSRAGCGVIGVGMTMSGCNTSVAYSVREHGRHNQVYATQTSKSQT